MTLLTSTIGEVSFLTVYGVDRSLARSDAKGPGPYCLISAAD